MICNNCGTENNDGSRFCIGCGQTLTPAGQTTPDGQQTSAGQTFAQEQPTPGPTPTMQGAPTPGPAPQYGPNGMPPQGGYNTGRQGYAPILNYNPRYSYEPISMWGYFGYSLLFGIPLVGFILLLVFSFGGTKNINVRNFARSFFCWLIILVILTLILLAVAGFSFYKFGRMFR